MDFSLNDDQRLLQESLGRFLQDSYDFESRQAAAASAEGFSRETWQALAELGLLAATLSPEQGGLGGGGVDLMVVMEELGKALAVEPYLASVVLCAGLIEDLGSPEQQALLLPGLVEGRDLFAFAQGEPAQRYDLNRIETRAERRDQGWVLTGRKAVVVNGDTADRLLVSARSAGAVGDEAGIGLFLIDATAAGVGRQGYPTIDGYRAAEIVLEAVPAEPLGAPDAAFPAIEAAVARALVALSAEAVGAMTLVCDTTLDYLKTRKQFGVTIGSFQVLQHRMVEMRMALEDARSLTILAAAKLTAPRLERERAVSAAKAGVGRAARKVSEEAIQLHGGIAMTWEYPLSHYAKRLIMLDHLFGDADHHEERFARLESV
ncbi:MAG: pimeloyl-CoA dehydrogenase small subunit [Rhodospirillales bacterium]